MPPPNLADMQAALDATEPDATSTKPPSMHLQGMQAALDSVDAEDEARSNRGFFGDVAAGYNASVAGLARGLTAAGNAVGLVGDDTAAGVSRGAQEVEQQVGSSRTAGLTHSAIDLAQWFVPVVGQATGAIGVAGNERQDVRDRGGSNLEANTMALAAGGAALAVPKIAEGVTGGVSGQVAQAITARLGGMAGRVAGGAAQHAITGAATGAGLTTASAAIHDIDGQHEQALAELKTLPEQTLLGAGIGAVTGGAHGASDFRAQTAAEAAGAHARAMARAVDEAHLGPMGLTRGDQQVPLDQAPLSPGGAVPTPLTMEPQPTRDEMPVIDPSAETQPDLRPVMDPGWAADPTSLTMWRNGQSEPTPVEWDEPQAPTDEDYAAVAARSQRRPLSPAEQRMDETRVYRRPGDPSSDAQPVGSLQTARAEQPTEFVDLDREAARRAAAPVDEEGTRSTGALDLLDQLSRVNDYPTPPVEPRRPDILPQMRDPAETQPVDVPIDDSAPRAAREQRTQQIADAGPAATAEAEEADLRPYGEGRAPPGRPDYRGLLQSPARFGTPEQARTPLAAGAPLGKPPLTDPGRVKRMRAQFAADPQRPQKVQALRQAGLTIPEITKLVDRGQVDEAIQAHRDANAAFARDASPAAHAEAEEATVAPPVGGADRTTLPSAAPAAPTGAPGADLGNGRGPVADLPRANGRRTRNAPPLEAAAPNTAPSAEAAVGAEPASASARFSTDEPVRQAEAPTPDSGPEAPAVAASATPEPLPVHAGLGAPRAVLDESRRPPPAPPSRVAEEDRQTAIDAIQPYKGNKRAAFTPVTEAVRGTFGPDAEKIETVHDPFGGGGGYGLGLTLSEFPNAKKLVVGELSQGRLDKIQFIHEQGSLLRKRAIETGMYGAVKRVWQTMRDEGLSGSGGGVQGRTPDAVIEDYFKPGHAGDVFARERSIDPAEARAIVHAYLDGMERRSGDFDALVANAERAALHGHIAAEAFKARGGEIQYQQGDGFATQAESGPHVAMVLDPPYVGTTGYGVDRGRAGGTDLYAKTAQMLEAAKQRGNSSVYTDEAWWAKGTPEAPAVDAENGAANDHILDRAQAATDKWSFFKVGNRTESVAVTNGFRPAEHARVHPDTAESYPYGLNEPVRQAGAGDATDRGAPAVAAQPRGGDLHDTAERNGPVEQRLAREAAANVNEKRKALQASRDRGRVTPSEAEERYQRMHDAEVDRLREKLPPADRQANEVERATAERAKSVPADPARRVALKKALGERNLPGEVHDDPLGVRLNLKNGSSVLFVDSGVPESSWDIKNWTASVMARPNGGEALRAAMKRAGVSLPPTREKSTLDRIHSLPRAKQLALMREMPPVAGVLEGAKGAPRAHAFDADFVIHAGKVVDSLISGGRGHALDEEMSQVIWRLMPEADRKAVMGELAKFVPGVKDTASAAAEEAFAQWAERRPSLMKPLVNEPTSLLGKALRAVRGVLSKLLPVLKTTPHVTKDAAQQVYERVRGGDYLSGATPTERAAAPTAPAQGAPKARFATKVPLDENVPLNNPTALRARQEAMERGELTKPKPAADDETRMDLPPVRMATDEQAVRETLRESARARGDIPDQTDEAVQSQVDEMRAKPIEAQRAMRDRIVAYALLGKLPDATDQAFLKALIRHEADTLDRNHTPDAARRYLEAQTQDAIIGSMMGAAFRQRRFDIGDEGARRDFIRHTIHQIRGADAQAYEKALKQRAAARKRGNGEAVARAQATLDRITTKAVDSHNKLRAELMRKYGVDLDDPQLGRLFASRYSIQQLFDTVAAHRKDFTLGDVLATSYTEGVLSLPTTAGKNIIGNSANYLWRAHLQPAIEAAMSAVGLGNEDTRSFGELRHMMSATLPGLKEAFKSMRLAYLAGHDVNEEAAVGTRTGLALADTPSQKHAPGLIKLATGLDMSYASTRIHSALDAFYKTWAAHSFVAGEAYRVARSEGLTGDAVGERVHDILHGGPSADLSGAWERGYRQAKRVTFQESFDKELTPEGIRRVLNGIVKFTRARVGVGRADIQPGVFLLPFIGTPFGILRQGASFVPPFQALKMLARGAGGSYRGDRPKLLHDASHLVAGMMLTYGLSQLVHKDDDKTWITGSDSDYRSGEGAMERRKTVAPPRSIKIPGYGWVSYKNVEPIASALAPIVDMMRGRGAKQAVEGLGQQWLLEQAHDVVAMGSELAHLDASLSDLTSTDPETASKLAKGTRATRQFLVNTAAGILVPNLVRGGIKLVRDAERGTVAPTTTGAPRPGESLAGLTGTNLLQAMTGGAFHSAPPTVDLYGRDIPNGLATSSDLAMHLLGTDNKPLNDSPWDSMIVRWNRKVADDSIVDKKTGKSLAYQPDNWPTTYKWHKQTFAKTPEQVEEFNRAAGEEFTARLQAAADRDALHPENPTRRDIEHYKDIKAAVHAKIEHRLAREWQGEHQGTTNE